MFTGIVQAKGIIAQVERAPFGLRLAIDLGVLSERAFPGGSVAVSGVCLTVVHRRETNVAFDVVHETLRRTTLSRGQPGNSVNIELALRAGDPLDGHIVQGHVDGVARVDRVESRGGEQLVWIRPDAALLPYIVPKGSIAVEGVSLTVVQVRGGSFCVALIPTTLERTTLGRIVSGDYLNLETDIMLRAAVGHLHTLFDRLTDGSFSSNGDRGVQPLTRDSLVRAGFR